MVSIVCPADACIQVHNFIAIKGVIIPNHNALCLPIFPCKDIHFVFFRGIYFCFISIKGVMLEAALFLNPLRLFVPQEMTTEDHIKTNFFEKIPDQSLPPILFREHIPNLTAFFICKFGKVIFIVLLNTERANYFALIFQSKSLLVTDEHIQNLLGFPLGFVGLPARHLTNTVN